jgi:hypothetical protein
VDCSGTCLFCDIALCVVNDVCSSSGDYFFFVSSYEYVLSDIMSFLAMT